MQHSTVQITVVHLMTFVIVILANIVVKITHCNIFRTYVDTVNILLCVQQRECNYKTIMCSLSCFRIHFSEKATHNVAAKKTICRASLD